MASERGIGGAETVPVVIIDDEADQASVATARINGLICEILELLPKAAYIGYTATPFANLLIDPSAEDSTRRTSSSTSLSREDISEPR